MDNICHEVITSPWTLTGHVITCSANDVTRKRFGSASTLGDQAAATGVCVCVGPECATESKFESFWTQSLGSRVSG